MSDTSFAIMIIFHTATLLVPAAFAALYLLSADRRTARVPTTTTVTPLTAASRRPIPLTAREEEEKRRAA